MTRACVAVTPARTRDEKAFRARWALLPGGRLGEHVRVEVRGVAIHRVAVGEPGGAEEDTDLGNSLLLPGLVNAHTHFELYALDGPIRAGGFGAWLTKVGLRRASMSRDTIIRRAREAAQEMSAEGVAYVGEVTTLGMSPRALAGLGFGGALYLETAGRRGGAAALMRSALRTLPKSALAAGLEPGMFPHAPYSASPERYAAALRLADGSGFRLATHASESPDESKLFRDGGGGLRLASRLAGVRPHPGTTSVEWLDRLGFLREGVALVHGNEMTEEDAKLVAGRGASVVLCPSSAAHFGHGPPPLRMLLDAGVRVAVGTDSPASGGSASLWREVLRLRRLEPGVEPCALLVAATEGGARVLGMPEGLTGIRPGASARLATVAITSDARDPLAGALAEGTLPSRVS